MQQPYHPPDSSLSTDADIARQVCNRIIRQGNEAERQREQERLEREAGARSPTTRSSGGTASWAALVTVLTTLVYVVLDVQRGIPAGQETIYAVAIGGAISAGLLALVFAIWLIDLVFKGIALLITEQVKIVVA